jgi:multiple sugar transport system permease protein
MILALTGGGPGRATEVLALFMYLEAFSRFHVGKAAAIAVLMLLVNVVMTIIYMRVFLNEEGV